MLHSVYTMLLLCFAIATVHSIFPLCIVNREHLMAQDNSELDDLCGRLQLPNSTTSAVKRLMSVLYSLGVVEVNFMIFLYFS